MFTSQPALDQIFAVIDKLSYNSYSYCDTELSFSGKMSVFVDSLITKSVYQPLSVNREAILNELLDEGRSENKFTWRVNS